MIKNVKSQNNFLFYFFFKDINYLNLVMGNKMNKKGIDFSNPETLMGTILAVLLVSWLLWFILSKLWGK